jgi:hypothetical protein
MTWWAMNARPYQVVEVGEVPRRLREQEVAGQDGDAGAVQAVDGGLPAARVAVVQQLRPWADIARRIIGC